MIRFAFLADTVNLSTTIADAHPMWAVVGEGASVFDDGDFVAERPGTYTVLMFEDDWNHRGVYSLSVQGVSESLACGTQLSCGIPAVEILGEVGDTDTLSFEIVDLGTVDVSVATVNPIDPLPEPAAISLMQEWRG